MDEIWIILIVSGVRITRFFVLCEVFCRSVFVPFFFWPLCCRSFFDLWILMTSLVSSDSSCMYHLFAVCNSIRQMSIIHYFSDIRVKFVLTKHLHRVIDSTFRVIDSLLVLCLIDFLHQIFHPCSGRERVQIYKRQGLGKLGNDF